MLSLQACEQAALGTQFAHSECSGILFIAGSFFWIAHFSSMAIIAFTDISGDVDYFAFVSHLYGKGLQVEVSCDHLLSWRCVKATFIRK